MSVYFIQSGLSGPIKIGVTSGSAYSRLTSLQTGSPETLYLVGVVKGWGAKEESRIHSAFESYRLRGEWFRADTELLKFIRNNAHPLDRFDWGDLIKLEPRLTGLLGKIHRVSRRENECCCDDLWFGFSGFKRELVKLAGWSAERWYIPELNTSRAYEVAYEKLYHALPFCLYCEDDWDYGDYESDWERESYS